MKNLKKLRQEKCFSQQKLADALHISQQSIYKYENGIAIPNLETLIKMADFFETSVDYLIGYTEISHKIEPLNECVLNHDEKVLVQKYDQLPPPTRKIIQLVMDEYLKSLSK